MWLAKRWPCDVESTKPCQDLGKPNCLANTQGCAGDRKDPPQLTSKDRKGLLQHEGFANAGGSFCADANWVNCLVLTGTLPTFHLHTAPNGTSMNMMASRIFIYYRHIICN